MAYKKKTREELQEEINNLTESAMENIQNYMDSPEDILEYANFMAQFHDYSAKNTILINKQFPGATAVASAKKFMDAGFYINKGEKSIRVFAPVKSKIFTGQDGKSKTYKQASAEEKKKIENGEIKLREKTYFKLVPVFDVSQTQASAEDLPKIFPNRHYNFDYSKINVDKLHQALVNHAQTMGIPVLNMIESQYKGLELGSAKGSYVPGVNQNSDEIVMNERYSKSEQIPTLIHEITHATLHKDSSNEISHNTEEFQAELTSYIVCKHFGMDTSEEAIPYIASWTKNGEKIDDKVNSIMEVKDTSGNLIRSITEKLEILDAYQEISVPEENKVTDINHYIQVEFNENDSGINIPNYAEQIVTKEIITQLKAFDDIQESKSDYYKFYFEEFQDGNIINSFRMDVGDGVDRNKDIYDRLEEYALTEEQITMLNEQNETEEVKKTEAEIEQEESSIAEENLEQEEEKEEDKEDKKLSFKEQIALAKSVSIVDISLKNGIELIQDSRNQFRLADNHSVVITANKNLFIENNGNIGGSSIDFVQQIMGIESFKEAVNFINGTEYEKVDLEQSQNKEPYKFEPSVISSDFSKARDYLVNTRCIDPDIVDCLHKKGFIQQDKKNNVLFLWNDVKNQQIVGCSEKGTNPDKPWRKIQTNSSSDFGFNIKKGTPNHLKFFESSIDMLSYISMNKNNNQDTWFISMEGLKPGTVVNYLGQARDLTNHDVKSISLCVDNDEAGKNFVKEFAEVGLKQKDKETIGITEELPTTQMVNLPEDKAAKDKKIDWNSLLIMAKENQKQAQEQDVESALEI